MLWGEMENNEFDFDLPGVFFLNCPCFDGIWIFQIRWTILGKMERLPEWLFITFMAFYYQLLLLWLLMLIIIINIMTIDDYYLIIINNFNNNGEHR